MIVGGGGTGLGRVFTYFFFGWRCGRAFQTERARDSVCVRERRRGLTPESSVGETESVIVAPPSSLCHPPLSSASHKWARKLSRPAATHLRRGAQRRSAVQVSSHTNTNKSAHTHTHKRCQLQTPGSAGGRGTGDMGVNSRELGLANCRRAL